jgi:hypothetical protein
MFIFFFLYKINRSKKLPSRGDDAVVSSGTHRKYSQIFYEKRSRTHSYTLTRSEYSILYLHNMAYIPGISELPAIGAFFFTSFMCMIRAFR